VWPSASPAVLAKFPPTLFISGTRSADMSGATRSEIELVKAGVDARLFLWDGMEHGFFMNPDLPESREAYQIMWNFFKEQMDKAARHAR
jgi:acetyl esterase/lipase